MSEFQLTDFDPSRTNPVYDLFAPSWRMCRDFAEMHEHILREGTYLDRFGEGTSQVEPASQFNWRKQASFAVDYCSDLIELRVGNIFRTSPVRTFDSSPWADVISQFINNVDGGATHMDQFMSDALRKYYTTGVDIVVDKPANESEAVQTQEDETNLGLLPYVSAFTPLERVDWSCDHAGRYLWVRYNLGTQAAVDEDSESAGCQYLTLSGNQWRVYRVDDEEQVSVNTGDIKLGIAPVVRFYSRESSRPEYRGVPLSLLMRIVPVARALLNVISQGQLDIYMAMGVLAAIGVDPKRLPTEISPMCWLGLPEGASLEHIRPAVEHIAEKREWISMMMEAILRMGRLTGPAAELKTRASSGIQVAAERSDLDNELASTASQMEHVEREIIRLAVSRIEGRLIDHSEIKYNVEYNRRYVLASADNIVKQAREFFDTGLAGNVPQIGRVFLQRILDSILKKDDPRYQQVSDAIQKAEF